MGSSLSPMEYAWRRAGSGEVVRQTDGYAALLMRVMGPRLIGEAPQYNPENPSKESSKQTE
jgi:hypothetical protein